MEESGEPPPNQLVRHQGPNPVPGQATSVATVAIQSGQSRVVIAVLRVSCVVVIVTNNRDCRL